MNDRPATPIAALARYVFATAGPVAAAGSQFVLSLVLLKGLEPAGFGRFSILVIASQFSWGVWSALFCAPMPTLVAAASPERREHVLRTLLGANLIGAGLGFLVFAAVSLAVGLSIDGALLFGAYATFALLRWFARSYAYVAGQFWRTATSDFVYSAALIAGAGTLMLLRLHTIELACDVLMIASLLSLLPFGTAYLAAQFARFDGQATRDYAGVWRSQSGWSLLGVIAIEATANAHAYVVTAIVGPTAFAPLAAAALATRPMNVLTNALTDLERAQMARHLADRRADLAHGSMRLFRTVLFAAWCANAALVWLLFHFVPQAVLSGRYDTHVVMAAATIWMAVAAVRLTRGPEAALLQASGFFRTLAYLGLAAGALSLCAVTILLFVAGPLASLLGIVVGETFFAIGAHLSVRRYAPASQRSIDTGPGTDPAGPDAQRAA